MDYYDVIYKSPAGYQGIHNAVEAENEFDAAKISPIMLCYGTPWSPEEFTVLRVQPSLNKPIIESQQ